MTDAVSTIGVPWLECRDVLADLAAVEAGLLAAVPGADPFVHEIGTHLIRGGGKRLRPALTLLAVRCGTAAPAERISVSVAMELLHVATLYHDDVVDEASARRGVPSVNARWGNRAATFAGTYLFALATERFAAAGDAVNQSVSAAVARLWEGQTRERDSVYRLDLEEQDYFEIIERKTATLYQLPCRVGALLGRAPPAAAAALETFGRCLGLAFQLVDDVRDIVADTHTLGKPPGSDLCEGVYTLPAIATLRSDGEDGRRLRALLGHWSATPSELVDALDVLRSNGSVPRTLATARELVTQAQAALGALPAGPARTSLRRLADFVIDQAGGLDGA
jgi:heptaprenyl diphosphate synthase